ncbi:polysaccharide deacetylase family protein [candidate division WOR-3 bacterium]|nr:polysaccharide deacetylase family protein [candidate division WOR-3 bacterium]
MKSILLYHNIAPTIGPYGSIVTPDTFKKHIRFIKRQGLPILSPKEFFSARSGVLITFDDGFLELYKYAFPILMDEEVSALIFVVSGYAGKKNAWDISLGKSFTHLPWDKIKEMYRYNIAIGSHSHLHPDYTRSSKITVEKDVKESFERISEEIGERIVYLSYPFGRAKREHWLMAQEVGFEKAFTSIPVGDSNPFYLGRWGVYSIDNIYNLSAKLGINKKAIVVERWKCKTINWFSNGTGVAKQILNPPPPF